VASQLSVLVQIANAYQAPLPVISVAPSKPTAHASTSRGPQNCAIWRRFRRIALLVGAPSICTGIARYKFLEESQRQRPRLGHRPEGDDAPCHLMPSCIAGESRDDEVGTSYRLLLTGFPIGAACLSAAGVYSQLVEAHIGPRGMMSADREGADAQTAAHIKVAQSKVGDIDRRLSQIDAAMEEATRRDRTKGAMKPWHSMTAQQELNPQL
jgi:hypothetical protein